MEARLVEIKRRETLKYLGYPGGPLPEDILEQLETGEREILRRASPRVIWRLFDRSPAGELAGTGFTPAGNDIRVFLKESRAHPGKQVRLEAGNRADVCLVCSHHHEEGRGSQDHSYYFTGSCECASCCYRHE